MAAASTVGTGDLSKAPGPLEHAEAVGGPPALMAAVRGRVRRLNGADQIPVPDGLQTALPHELASEPMFLLILGEHAGNRRNIRQSSQSLDPAGMNPTTFAKHAHRHSRASRRTCYVRHERAFAEGADPASP
jgi:hypothetical protein